MAFQNTASLATLASFAFISLGNLLLIAWDKLSASWLSAAGGLAVIVHRRTDYLQGASSNHYLQSIERELEQTQNII